MRKSGKKRILPAIRCYSLGRNLFTIILCAGMFLVPLKASGLQVVPLSPTTPLRVTKPNPVVLKALLVSIPDVRSLTLREASLKLERSGLRIKTAGTEFHPTIPKGQIISQSPRPAQKVPEKSTVEVVVSKGPAPMPDLIGEKVETALKLLSGREKCDSLDLAPYHLKIVQKDVNSRQTPGTIIGQEPPKGQPLGFKGVVTLFVSKGNFEVLKMKGKARYTPTRKEGVLRPENISRVSSKKHAKPSVKTIERHPKTISRLSPSRVAENLRIPKKRVAKGKPVKIIVRDHALTAKGAIFYIGRRRVFPKYDKRPGEILIPTVNVPPGTYPLTIQTRGKRTVIGRVVIEYVPRKHHSHVREAKKGNGKKTCRAAAAARKAPPGIALKTASPPSPTKSSQKSSREQRQVKTFIFMADAKKLPRLKDILLKEAPGFKIVKTKRLKSLNAVILSIQTPDAARLKRLAERLIARKIIKSFQASHTYRTFGGKGDPYASRQYGVQPPQRLLSLQSSCAGRRIHIALLDTGVDIHHEDLNGKKIEMVDFTGEGLGRFLSDIHGTALCGIIAAVPGNGKGIMGLAPGAKVHAIKVCKSVSPSAIEATTDSFTLAEGLDYAIQKRVHIINISIGGPRDKIIEKLIRRAISVGITVVAAVGNGGPRAPPSYPAAYPGVIGVTAVDRDLNLYPHAPRGRFVDIAAPGVDVFSLKPGNRYNFYTGTSFAAAYVTGILALRLAGETKSVSFDPLAFLRAAAFRPPRHPPDEMGAGILILSKIPNETFLK